MNFENYFPLWNDLNTAQKKLISDNLITQEVKKGTIIHNGNLDCTGLLLVKSGQLRTYILSDEGREITLYRLFDMVVSNTRFENSSTESSSVHTFPRDLSERGIRLSNKIGRASCRERV